MKRPLCRLVPLALLVLFSIKSSYAKNRHAGVHTGPHVTSGTSPGVGTKASKPAKPSKPDKKKPGKNKPEKHHAGDGGKHDSGVDGKHPDKMSKTAKTTTAASYSLDSPATSHNTEVMKEVESKTGKTGTKDPAMSLPAPSHNTEVMKEVESKTGKTETNDPAMPVSMSYAKSYKDSTPSDSKANKGDAVKSDKEAPNEYNGVKMVVKTPEGGYRQPKSGKESHTSTAGETGEMKGDKPMVAAKSGKTGVEKDATTMFDTNSTTIVDATELPAVPAETSTTRATEAAPPAATTTQAAAMTTPAIEESPPVPEKRIDNSADETPSPTYSPTSLYVEQTSSVEETFTAMDPFGLRFVSSRQQPQFNLETVTTVTMEHLLHSFRTKGWDADRLKLMLLDEEDERRRSLRQLDSFPVYELVFGGILYFKTTTEMPTKAEENDIVEQSFSGARLRYFINLLKEEGVDIASASWGHLPSASETSAGRSNKLTIILGSVFGSIALIIAVALLVRRRNQRSRRIEDGSKPGSVVFRIKDEVESMMDSHRDNSTIPSSLEENEGMPSRYSYYSKQPLIADPVSPLDSPDDTVSTNTRYVSVFTVKKDCGGKPLEEVDLRSLAVAYLSRLFKKVPDTCLLPCDKESSLPAINSVRNIPDDLQELLEYVGNPRIDENTGKVLFNLRCESNVPMSKMKNLSSQKLPKQQRSRPTVNVDRAAASGFEDVSL